MGGERRFTVVFPALVQDGNRFPQVLADDLLAADRERASRCAVETVSDPMRCFPGVSLNLPVERDRRQAALAGSLHASRSGGRLPQTAGLAVRAMHLATAIAGSLALAAAAGVTAEELRNWFDDPFFPVASAIPRCPEPAGPRVTEAERRVQAHSRVEKGTSCWLAKEEDCERSNAYAYDKEIASEIRNALAGNRLLDRSSLWVTVQGRVVYVEGCVRTTTDAKAIENLIRGLPHVRRAMAIVTTTPGGKPPYRVVDPW